MEREDAGKAAAKVTGKVTIAQLKILARILFTSQKQRERVYLLLCGQLCFVLLQEVGLWVLGRLKRFILFYF